MWFPALFLLPAIIVALFEPEDGFNGFFFLTYLALPLFFAPLAASQTARDHANGLIDLHGAGPARPLEVITGRSLGLLALLVLCVAVTTPVYLVALSPASAWGLVEGLNVVGFGVLVGLASILIGTLVAIVLGVRKHLAQSGTFVLVGVWISLGPSHEALVTAASGGAGWPLRFLLVSSPFAWALGADGLGPLLVEDSGQLALALLLLAAGVAGAISVLVAGKRSILSPNERSAKRRRVGATAVIAVTMAALALWFPLSPLEEHTFPETVQTPDGHSVDIQLYRSWPGYGNSQRLPMAPWSEEMHGALAVEIRGRPNETVTIHGVEMRSRGISFAGADEDTPKRLFLSPVENRDPSEEESGKAGQRFGYGETEFPFSMEPEGLTHKFPRVAVDIVLDGERASFAFTVWSRWVMPTGATVTTAIVTALILAASARVLPSRWNAW